MKLYTAQALAGALGMTTTEVNSLYKKKVISHEKGKLFALEDSAAKIIAYYRQRDTRAEALDYSTERAMLMRAKRIREEHELDLQEGLLHSADDVEKTVGNMLLNFRARILSIPAKLAPSLAKEESRTVVFKLLKEAMEDALNELSDYDTLFENGEEN